ncbi:sigma-E factor regulatory protein RseB [Moellerella wisconsensis]|uniref:sigma-E factor regulatory protein RseB n=1 Tax=Moellerella wisconsensis TaxID=158849 RepID=UPI0030762232
MKYWLSVVFLAGGLLASSTVSAAQSGAETVLEDMGNAAQRLSYEVSFITISPQSITPGRYRYGLINKQPVAQMIQMDSSRREIVQKGNVISYFEPGFDAFSLNGQYIVDHLPSVIFANFPQLSAYYNFIDAGRTHIGDRPCLVIRVISKDNSRFNYVLLIDEETRLPLRIDLLDNNNETLEQFRVISTVLDSKSVHDSLIALSKLNLPPLLVAPKNEKPAFTWRVGSVPPGFEEISRSRRNIQQGDQLETAMFSDGLFSFSVNVTKAGNGKLIEQPISRGRRTIYTLTQGQNEVTIIGELPLATAKQIASSIHF